MGSSQGRAYRNGTTFYAINLWSSTQELDGNTTRINWGANVQFGDWYYWGVRLHVAVDGVEVGSWTGACTSSWQTVINVSGSRDIGRGHSGRGVTVSAWTTSETVSGYGGVGTTTSCQHGETVNAKPAYTISYNANGGSGAPVNQTKWYGENLTLSTGKPTRTGHNFSGWATSASGAVAYQPGAVYTGNAALTLYAKWTPHTYTVSYNANGGSGAPGNQTKTYGQTLKLSSTIPTRKNYNFLGWGTSAGSTTVAYKAGADYTANAAITLYAIWELAWLEPRITNLQATRCDSAGTLKEDGPYAKVTFSWATDRTISSIKIVCNGATTTPTGTGTSGSVNVVIGNNKLDTEQSYTVNVTVTDAIGGITIQTVVPAMNYIMDISPSGAVAFGGPAPQSSKEVLIHPSTITQILGPLKGFQERGLSSPEGSWTYKLLAKSSLPYDSNTLAGAVRVVGQIGGYSSAPIDVTVTLRSASTENVFISDLGRSAFRDADTASLLAIIGNDKYVYIYVTRKGYYAFNLRFEGFGFFIINSDWQESHIDGIQIFDSRLVKQESFNGYPLKSNYKNGHFGITNPRGDDSDWCRTTLNGLIPYSSDPTNGHSALGTSTWPFRIGWINELNWTGSGLKGRVMKKIWSGTWNTGSVTIPDLPHYNVLLVRSDGSATSGTSILVSRTNKTTFIGASGYIESTGNHITVFWADLTSSTTLRSTGSGSNPAIRNERPSANFSNSLPVNEIYGLL